MELLSRSSWLERIRGAAVARRPVACFRNPRAIASVDSRRTSASAWSWLRPSICLGRWPRSPN